MVKLASVLNCDELGCDIFTSSDFHGKWNGALMTLMGQWWPSNFQRMPKNFEGFILEWFDTKDLIDWILL